MRVLSISSSRADVGILEPVWRALESRAEVRLHLLLTGMHMAEDAAMVVPAGAALHRAGADLGGGGPDQAAAAMAAIAAAASGVYTAVAPDVVVVVGDRLDMIPAAVATLPFNLPLVHLHGGERTEGAIDERIRHALTKLAHLHCVATAEAGALVAAMGEEQWRIQVTGAPGLDTLIAAPTMAVADFAAALDLAPDDGLCLVTVHPETNGPDPAAPLNAVLAALDRAPMPTLFTAPNTDPGGAAMRAQIEAFVARRPWAAYRATLGGRLYANALRHATVMVGNSSSGIIEAALFGLAVINVGARQRGRTRGPNVHDCAAESTQVSRLLGSVAGRRYDPAQVSLYGDGRSGPRIAQVITELPDRDKLMAKLLVGASAVQRTGQLELV